MSTVSLPIQSVGDGAQGWCNALLYIVLSPKIRQRLIRLLLSPICNCLYDATRLLQNTTVDDKPNSVSSIQYRSGANNAINEPKEDTSSRVL